MALPFVHDDFLLHGSSARRLYHEHAVPLPIIDYHCHLPPADIATDRAFVDLTEIWLAGDHYKWRAMRTCGVDERFITGDAPAWEKFQQWAATVPKLLRNPLYHWTHLELRRPFGITDRLLDPSSARSIWDECNAKLQAPGFSARGLLRAMDVEIVCTTDDPSDDLRHHRALASDSACTTRVFPTFRPDRALSVGVPAEFRSYAEQLAAAAGEPAGTYAQFIAALQQRHDFFHEQGCRVSDHGLETVYAEVFSVHGASDAFATLMAGRPLTPREALELQSAILHELALMDHARGWVQQFHLGALRNNNTRKLRTLGPDTGFDSIADNAIAKPLARFLDRLDSEDKLAKTILYNLNPRDNELLATMIGSFQDGKVAGKLQYGAAWWFLDQLNGMTRQLDALSNMGVLSQFVGMLTDSRSFLSYPRHEYFRRLLCQLLGSEIDKGELPNDLPLVGRMVEDICYRNAQRYFGFPASR